MISTHKMLAAAGIENKAQIIDQASTLSSNTHHFFDCSETAPVSTITDVVKGATLTDDLGVGASIVSDGAIDGTTVKVKAYPTQNIGATDFDSPDGLDYIIIASARSVDAGLDVDDNGAVSFYYGDAANGHMKLQPYYAAFFDSTDALPFTRSTATTPFVSDYARRTVGEDYMFAGLKKGSFMQHYAQGDFTGSVNVVEHYDGYLAAKWNNQIGKGTAIQLGHSSYGTQATCEQSDIASNVCEIAGEPIPSVFNPIPPNTGTIVNKEQDYYGILVHFFPNGAPSQSEIENGLRWMKPQWLLGNKVIYPGWMF